jgi:nucleoside-diphosphate-sugar epimerase
MPNGDTPVCVTGSSGFVGKHLCGNLTAAHRELIGLDRLEAPAGATYRPVQADIQHLDQIRDIGAECAGRRMIHLAAEAEVVTPWDLIPAIFSTNLVGAWNLLTAFRPRLFVFASSSAVYGTASVRRALPRLSASRPLSLYGASKSMGELLLRDWTKEFGSAAVVLRLGNVVGGGCRGLIPYLVGHAKRYRQADVRAELRGHGRLLRDYTPVEFVSRIFAAALDLQWKTGSCSIFNVGTGRGLTNRAVAEMVRRVLAREGYRLECNWDNPVPASEAIEIVPNCESLERRFGMPLPSVEEVEASIEQSVLSHLRA